MKRIYTRAGDQGKTSLGNGKRVAKNDPLIDLVGELDELNASLGLAVSLLGLGRELTKDVTRVQSQIFGIGANLMGAPGTSRMVREAWVVNLEADIDSWWLELPPLANFILPGGHPAAAVLHSARAIARRAERKLIKYGQGHKVGANIYSWFNRLSDWLFVAARRVNHQENVPEEVWGKDRDSRHGGASLG